MSAESWKLTLPCTRAEAEAIDIGDLWEGGAEIDPIPLLMTTEDVIDDAERWHLDAYFEREPDAATIALVRALVPSAGDAAPAVERLAGEDWVTLSQAGLEPVRAGRFVVHTAASPADAPPGGRAFRIEASQAFGTGHHETTAGCLEMLDRLAGAGERFANIVDLGTGTGLLAFAALELWPDAAVMATDIDAIAIDVTRENAAINAVPEHAVALVVADGIHEPAIAAPTSSPDRWSTWQPTSRRSRRPAQRWCSRGCSARKPTRWSQPMPRRTSRSLSDWSAATGRSCACGQRDRRSLRLHPLASPGAPAALPPRVPAKAGTQY